MNRATVSILIEDDIRKELDANKKAAMHINQKNYWQQYYSDRISQSTFNRIYKAWKEEQLQEVTV